MSVPGSHEARGVSGRERDEQIRAAACRMSDRAHWQRAMDKGASEEQVADFARRTMAALVELYDEALGRVSALESARKKIESLTDEPLPVDDDGRKALLRTVHDIAVLAEGSAAQEETR